MLASENTHKMTSRIEALLDDSGQFHIARLSARQTLQRQALAQPLPADLRQTLRQRVPELKSGPAAAHNDQTRQYRREGTNGDLPGQVNPVTGKPSPGAGYAPRTVNHCETVLRTFYDFHREACLSTTLIAAG
jgi:hypothetical protein